mmetsp:Transcript_15969/g.29248  ORF Transcript_15969/g.29248 Transcript_15969/m.29248 type:complete len:96 (+) Transcript_15969:1413-1700(+)
MNHGRFDHHNTPEDDPYRNEIQGYIFSTDPSDERTDMFRGFYLFWVLFVVSGFAGFSLRVAMGHDDGIDSKALGDALLTAQKIEDFIEKVNKEAS